MEDLAFFLEPMDFLPWLLRVALVVLGSYVVVWLLAVVLYRVRALGYDDAVTRLHFAWLIPMTLQCAGLSYLLLYLCAFYRGLGVSLWYSGVLLVPLLFSAYHGLERSRGIVGRVERARRRLAGEARQ